MKKLLLFCLLLIAPLSVSAQNKKNEKTRFEVSGNCEMCKKRIEKAALTVKGIKTATWDIPSNVISVIYDPSKEPIQEVQRAIAFAGHDTPLAKALDSTYNALPMCCLYKRTIE
jgi:copper chaperone CopZ